MEHNRDCQHRRPINSPASGATPSCPSEDFLHYSLEGIFVKPLHAGNGPLLLLVRKPGCAPALCWSASPAPARISQQRRGDSLGSARAATRRPQTRAQWPTRWTAARAQTHPCTAPETSGHVGVPRQGQGKVGLQIQKRAFRVPTGHGVGHNMPLAQKHRGASGRMPGAAQAVKYGFVTLPDFALAWGLGPVMAGYKEPRKAAARRILHVSHAQPATHGQPSLPAHLLPQSRHCPIHADRFWARQLPPPSWRSIPQPQAPQGQHGARKCLSGKPEAVDLRRCP